MNDTLNNIVLTTLNNIAKSTLKISHVHGIGLFTTHSIHKDELLCRLDGQILPLKQYQEIRNSLSLSGDQKNILRTSFFMEYNHLSKTLILARPFRTKYSYINHSRTPSLLLNHSDCSVKAIRNIRPNEELTLDYRKEPLPESYLLGHGATYL